MSIKLAAVALIILNYPTLSSSSPNLNERAADEEPKHVTTELVAELHPYVVALMNTKLQYECSGTVLDERWVLTSGGCARRDLTYILIGAAVINKYSSNIVRIAALHVHPDHAYEAKATQARLSSINNDVGLVMAQYPILEEYLQAATLSTVHVTNLVGKKVELVGYGTSGGLGKKMIRRLHSVSYVVELCKNDMWNYCACGVQTNTTDAFEVGWGGPILFNLMVVGVASHPSGCFALSANGIYNVFTIIRPYLPWIEQNINYPVSIINLKKLGERNEAIRLDTFISPTAIIISCFIVLNH